MNILKNVEIFINEFNQEYNLSFNIDTIRIDFSKQYKKEKLDKLGNWKKIKKTTSVLHELRRRFAVDEVTSAYKLDNQNIYYYNKKDKTKKYRKATFVIFGMSQYNKKEIPQSLINECICILKNISNIDICLDIKEKPNISNLEKHFKLTRYIEPKSKKPTDTYYINDTSIDMIEKIVIYDKSFKNSLSYPLWRIEAKISIPNTKYLALPLYEFKKLIDLVYCK